MPSVPLQSETGTQITIIKTTTGSVKFDYLANMPTKAANLPSQCDPDFTVTASTGLMTATLTIKNGFRLSADDSTVNQDITVTGTWWNTGDS